MTSSELFEGSDVQRSDWVFRSREYTGYVGFSGCVCRTIRKGIVTINSVYWTCPHIHRSAEAAIRCADGHMPFIV